MTKDLWQLGLRMGKSSEEQRHATWLELFYDLIFVVAIAQLARKLDENVSLFSFFSFLVLFLPFWLSWLGATFYATRFDTDDLVHRLLTVVQMVAIAAMAVNTHRGLGETSTGFALSYAISRFVLVIEYLRARQHIISTRPLTTRFALRFGIGATILLLSCLVQSPLRFVLWFFELTISFATQLSTGKLDVEFAPHASHLPERFGLFTLILLGESISAVVNGVTGQQWTTSSAIAAVFGITIAFSLWWSYFDNLSGSAIRAASNGTCIRCYRWWFYAHLPLAIGIATIGSGVKHLVSSAPDIALSSQVRWLVCCSAAICILSLRVIYLMGLIPEDRKYCKVQTAYRMGAAAVILIVALFGKELSPVWLIGLVATVCASQIIFNLNSLVDQTGASVEKCQVNCRQESVEEH
ncbi:low temperature requirement protein A (plasmid) [Nostoc edaphicum CCNP1411]|uniref:Low temperature requirement protein A n=1 Tax=Nostoc edaphicum CCNP1411 TaxID=1472755 RepID=A0A7D7Q8Y4_9NOSO|nr:low temperature requirement protein A [Nostoc edaphicum]QMS86237.1 low temperature requirement protein A [Nostoc edaphicum CCNP1411]